MQMQAIFQCFDEFKNTVSCTGYASGTIENSLRHMCAHPSKATKIQPHKAEPEAADRSDSEGEKLVRQG